MYEIKIKNLAHYSSSTKDKYIKAAVYTIIKKQLNIS